MSVNSFTQVFGGSNIYSAEPTYANLSISANTVLGWPTELTTAGLPVLAEILDVTATAAGLSLSLSDATQATVGYSALFNNIGSNSFTIKDYAGNTLAVVAPGQVWQLYLYDNTTQQGSWRAFQFGAMVSSANAATLAGAGLTAVATTINEQITISPKSVNYSIVNSDRASCIEWVGGSGSSFTLPNPAAVGAGWFCYVQNSGTGALTLATATGNINGNTSQSFQVYDSAIIACDGSNFITIGLGKSVASSFNFVQINVGGLSGNYTLAGAQLNRVSYRFIGALAGNLTVIVPGSIQQYWIDNETTGAYTFTVSQGGAGTTVTVPTGNKAILYCDSLNVVNAVSGSANSPGGSSTQVQYNNAGVFGGTSLTYQASSASFLLGAPTAGNVALTITGSLGALALTLNSGNTGANADFGIYRSGSTSVGMANALTSGPNLVLGNGTTCGSVFQSSGYQTEIWQYTLGNWAQVAYWSTNGGLVLNTPPGGGFSLTIEGVSNNHLQLNTTAAQYTSQYWQNNGLNRGVVYWDSVNDFFGVGSIAAGGGINLLYGLGFTGLAISSTGNVTINAPSSGLGLSVAGGGLYSSGGVTAASGGTISTAIQASLIGESGSGGNFQGGLGLNGWWDGSNWRTGTDGGSNGACFILQNHGLGALNFYTIPSTGGSNQTISTTGLGTTYLRMTMSASGIMGYSPNAAQLIDMTPDQGTWSSTLSGGFSSNPSGILKWRRQGSQVTVYADAPITGTSTASTDITASGVPASLTPSSPRIVRAWGFENAGGIAYAGIVTINTNNTFTFQLEPVNSGLVSGNPANLWSASGIKGIGVAGFSFTYSL